MLKTNSYCVLPASAWGVPLALPRVTDPLTGLALDVPPIAAGADGSPLAPAVFYPDARFSLDGGLFVIKGEWTLRQQVGLHLAGGIVLTHTEAVALLSSEEWTD